MSRRAHGLRAWLLQRVTAVYVAVFTVFLAAYLTFAPPESYAAWRDWMAQPAIGLAWAVFFVALLAHVWVGLRDVFMDYVHPAGLRLVALSLLKLTLWVFGFWAFSILFSVRFA